MHILRRSWIVIGAALLTGCASMRELFSGPVEEPAEGLSMVAAEGDTNAMLDFGQTVLSFLGPWGQTAAVGLGALAAFKRPRQKIVNAGKKWAEAVKATAAIGGLKAGKDVGVE